MQRRLPLRLCDQQMRTLPLLLRLQRQPQRVGPMQACEERMVIGGMGSIVGSIVAGFGLGILEGLAKVFYPEIAGMVVFIVMLLTLIMRPNGLFGND